jgi:hypothetical protein
MILTRTVKVATIPTERAEHWNIRRIKLLCGFDVASLAEWTFW